MDINSAGEEVDAIIRESLADIPNVANVHDVITIAGNSRETHDTALTAIFKRFSDLEITMNRNKCKFNQSSITCWGMTFSSKGVSPYPCKVDTLQYAVRSDNKDELQSFLCMAQANSDFIHAFSTKTFHMQ